MGLYRGAARNNCSLIYWIIGYIPITFHKLSAYDSHFFVNKQEKTFKKDDIGVIAENSSFNVNIQIKPSEVTNKEERKYIKRLSWDL